MIGLSSSTYYYQPKRLRASREREDVELRDDIEAVQRDFPRAGYRTVQVHLRRRGRWVGERKIRRVKCAEGCPVFYLVIDPGDSTETS